MTTRSMGISRAVARPPRKMPAHAAFSKGWRKRSPFACGVQPGNVSRVGASNMWGSDLPAAVAFPFPFSVVRRMRIFHLPALLALAAVASCGGSDSTTPVAKVVSRLSVSAANTTLTVGQTATLTAAAFEASGPQITNPGTINWTSCATTVGSVDQAGRVTALGGGSTTITASIAGVNGTLPIAVNPAGAVSKDTIFTPGIAFSPNTLVVKVGATVVFALGFDGTGHDVSFGTKTCSLAYIPVTARQYVGRTFSTAGTFPYTCPTHPEMTGTITVQ